MEEFEWPQYEDSFEYNTDGAALIDSPDKLYHMIKWIFHVAKADGLSNKEGFWKHYYWGALSLAEMIWHYNPDLTHPPRSTGNCKNNLRELQIWCDDPYPLQETSTSKNNHQCKHSPDFRSVSWFGKVFSFSPNQAACIKILWEAWENDTPEVGQDYILEATDCMSSRIVDIFKNHKTFREIISQGKSKGTWRLIEPE